MLNDNTMVIIYSATVFAVLAIISALFWIYRVLSCDKNSHNNSTVMRGIEMAQGLIEFSVEELKEATKNFNERHRIGMGCLGAIYIGLTTDGLVAVKKLSGFPHPGFLAEVSYISKIRHSNVVKLIGYCCNDGYQMLVYEYLFNGSLREHLSDLTFKKRIFIALGAAKGLQHLHNLNPPLQHKRFTMAKVLLDANFNPKISDAGLSRVLQEHDIHLRDINGGSEDTVDVFSFGLFLLELITGEKPQASLTSNDDIRDYIGSRICAGTLFDQRMTRTFRGESSNIFIKIMEKCLKYPAINRPNMDVVVGELEKIYENEVIRENRNVTPGSDLFTITIS